ncbi:MW1434 family type I TA system toxin [Burkholderia cepacia]|uniref:Thoeris anti-defense Tad2 family protein n=1 Tax=Burkholderia cepacia TaxID=292 RepID=UPI00398F6373
MIEPTVGRIVHFRPGKQAANLRIQCDPKQPLAAVVAYVHGPRMVNLAVLDALGRHHALASVKLLQDDDMGSDDEPFAEWMPFQKGQAAKTEEVIGTLAVALAAVPNPEPYRRIADVAEVHDFGFALHWMRQGSRVTREAWHAAGVFVYHVPAAAYPAQTGIAKQHFGDDALVPYHAYLAIKRADDTVCVFVPGMDSILAEDWVVLE